MYTKADLKLLEIKIFFISTVDNTYSSLLSLFLCSGSWDRSIDALGITNSPPQYSVVPTPTSVCLGFMYNRTKSFDWIA